jgi:hypothetical protein
MALMKTTLGKKRGFAFLSSVDGIFKWMKLFRVTVSYDTGDPVRRSVGGHPRGADISWRDLRDAQLGRRTSGVPPKC